MFKAIGRALFGTKSERDIKKIKPLIDQINALEPGLKDLSDEALQAKTGEFKRRLKEKLGSEPQDLVLQGDYALKDRRRLLEALDALLPEAFAVVREAAWRTIKQRPYDVQLIGGIVLHQGRISEMKTGEGKTLTSTLAIYLNALTGLGVHVVTVNDYLARRDAEWMGPIFNFLGLSVGYILTGMAPRERQESYARDITYGTNNEFGFDYLRDNMVIHPELRVQRKFYFCIVDEVDSILIDEARTPLIISGAAEDSTKKYYEVQKIIPRLKRGFTAGQLIDRKLDKLTDEKIEINTQLDAKEAVGREADLETRLEKIESEVRELNREKQMTAMNKKLNEPSDDGDYIVEESDRASWLTPQGVKKVEELLALDNLYSQSNMSLVHHVEQALKANTLFYRDVDYMVKDGQVIIVDEFTGRPMPGRRYSDGLHQALEAKEGLTVARENQTLATITFQNYFRMYVKLSGMTGTADTEAEEFGKIYSLGVVSIPTNREIQRIDNPDRIYRTEVEKVRAITDELERLHAKGQPVLVGTISVEKSERLSRMLKGRNIPHNVLNAKFHELEAEIVSQAGQVGRVTIATNMAGRGTDIVLGGNPEVQGRKLVENTLKNTGRKATSEEINEFVRLVLLGRDEALETWRESYPAFDQDLIKKVKTLQAECRENQKKVLEAGGLFILGTERHEARRIDNQLRGRGGRQGDPGESRFYISMEDDLMRLFGGERLKNVMHRLGMKEGEEIEHPLISRAIANAQKRVETRNFEIRKHLLKYDEVMNEQRSSVYRLRNQILDKPDSSSVIREMIERTVETQVDIYSNNRRSFDTETVEAIKRWLEGEMRIPLSLTKLEDLTELNHEKFATTLKQALLKIYQTREDSMGSQSMRILEKLVLLNTLDSRWKDHLYEMDALKEGINWMSYAEKDPLVEYKLRGMEIFNQMLESVDNAATNLLFHAELTTHEIPPDDFAQYDQGRASRDEFGQFDSVGGGEAPSRPVQTRERVQVVRGQKVGRNDPCPCGSGKKFKFCHGKK